MAKRLEDKAAVVTGSGAGGIGEQIALALAKEGAQVVVNDIKRESADEVVRRINEAGGEAVASYETVASMSGAQGIVKTALSEFGKIDILVNCAANYMQVRSFEMTEEQWDSIISVHLKGHFACIRTALPEMIKQKGGRIINFSSRGAFFGTRNVAYTTAKAGILGLSCVLADDLGEFGITVNAIMPSAQTKLFTDPTPRPLGGTPPSLSLDPSAVAPLIVYLCTDEAKSITGQIFYISGGDLCVYPRPIQVGGKTSVFVRKIGSWTVEELAQIIPPLI